MSEKSYDRIIIKDQSGKTKMSLERSFGSDLTLKTENGRTVIEKTGFWGKTETYMPSDAESVEAERW
jgi:hypothetical protein